MRTRRPDGGFRLYAEHFISAKTLGRPVAIKMLEVLESSDDFKPIKYFQKTDGSAGTPYVVRGDRVPPGGGQFRLRSEAGGKIIMEKTYPIEEWTFPQLVDQIIHTQDLAVGKHWEFRVINPVDFLPIRVAIAVERQGTEILNGRTISFFEITAKMGAVIVHSFVDTASTEPYRIAMPAMDLEYRLDDQSIAKKFSSDDPAELDLAHFAAVVPTGAPFSSQPDRAVKLKLSRVPFEDLQLEGDFQKIVRTGPEDWIIELRPVTPAAIFDDRRGESDRDAMRADSAATESAGQDTSSEVARVAGAIGETTPIRFAKAAVSWMQRHIRQVPTSIVPTPEVVLAIKQGDCNEFSALFQGLCRASGFQCKIASGLAYMDGQFFYHSWNEIRAAEGRWVPVDPIFGEVPAAVGHFKLIEGDFSATWRLASFLKTIRIEILDESKFRGNTRYP